MGAKELKQIDTFEAVENIQKSLTSIFGYLPSYNDYNNIMDIWEAYIKYSEDMDAGDYYYQAALLWVSGKLNKYTNECPSKFKIQGE